MMRKCSNIKSEDIGIDDAIMGIEFHFYTGGLLLLLLVLYSDQH